MCTKGIIPTRAVIAVMMFTSCFINYMLRVNMSINIIAMVEPSKTNGEQAVPECTQINRNLTRNLTDDGLVQDHFTSAPNYGTRFEWSPQVQGLILGAYFWGATITSMPGGFLAERFGPTKTILISTLSGGALTILGPLAAQWHYAALIVCRFVIGLGGGVIYPALHCLVARWAPPEEKGKFVGALLGGTLGTVVTWPLLSAIIQQWGWSWAFFVNGAIILAWCIVWFFLVSDTPDSHPRISTEEKVYIQKCIGNTVKQVKTVPPYKSIFLSIPFWALCILHYGNLWGLFFLMTAGPNYLSTVLGFNLGHTGFLASLPHLARLIFGLCFGAIGDFIRKRQLLPIVYVRKGFILFSHVIPGALLLVMNVIGCDVNWSIALLTLSLGSNGAATLTNLQNSQDLAPNFAGSLYGIINTVGSTTGFVTPLIVAYLTAEHNGLAEWHTIFFIGALVYIVCGLIFCLFGSAEMQKWNQIPDDEEKNEHEGIENVAFESNEINTKI